MTVRDASDIRDDLKKCEKYMVDGTKWDDDEDNNLSESTKYSKKVKFNLTAPAASMASASSTSESMVISLLADTPHERTPVVVQQKRQFSPRPLECDGCGKSDNAYEADDCTVLLCSVCKTWSHSACIDDCIDLSMPNKDGTWTCPTCREIVVWTDKK